MKKKKEGKAGYARILDAWIPGEDAGDPVGCVATTFTFNSAFFEEECLGRFLQLQTDATEDGPAYLIEREEKLAQLACAAVLVDQHHARGVRSLRWDLIPARPRTGIQHAKVSLLFWSKRVRLIVASANLTEDGYRRNLEVFGAIDYFEGSESPLSVLEDILAFLAEVASGDQQSEELQGPALTRWLAFLAQVRQVSMNWGTREYPRGYSKPRIHAVLSSPGRPGVLEGIQRHWPEQSPPAAAYVLSPFFDPPESGNEPAKSIWNLLRQRGDASVSYLVIAEEIPGSNALLLHAPESLKKATPKRGAAESIFERLKLEEGRPLHAKCLWLENDWAVVYLMGSSNFTSPGLGLGLTRNWEANLAYVINGQTEERIQKALDSTWPESDDLPSDCELRWLPSEDEGEDSASNDLLPLPGFFREATYSRGQDGKSRIDLRFSDQPLAGWELLTEDGDVVVASEVSWSHAGRPNLYPIIWTMERPPAGFLVSWQGCAGKAWWPVNVLNAASLPPPDDLRDLPLEILIDILTSAKPLHLALAAWVRRRLDKAPSAETLPFDPHKRVDTSSFLLQRTRRISLALNGLRQRLEKPVASHQALAWRLNGPVGGRALAQAIEREARSSAEKLFLLAELCLELSRARPQQAPGSLERAAVHEAIRKTIEDIRKLMPEETLKEEPELAKYCDEVFKEVVK
ncbi:MAG: hypothetical protein LC114_00050 [Bryobacterales bacterium]|nr:hypothetical protein [Bryobacterales bacterium]